MSDKITSENAINAFKTCPNVPTMFLVLAVVCEKEGIRFRLEYDTGHYVPGATHIEYMERGEEVPEELVKQGPTGWTAEVNMRVMNDDEGREMLYPKLSDALVEAARIVVWTLQEREGETT